ncbi:hypothetical protein L208DRAFT_1394322, partial [Tricholoma matsutake]
TVLNKSVFLFLWQILFASTRNGEMNISSNLFCLLQIFIPDEQKPSLGVIYLYGKVGNDYLWMMLIIYLMAH